MDAGIHVRRRGPRATEEDYRAKTKKTKKNQYFIYIYVYVLTFSYTDVWVLYIIFVLPSGVRARGGVKTQYNNGRTRKYATYTTRGGEPYYKYKTHIYDTNIIVIITTVSNLSMPRRQNAYNVYCIVYIYSTRRTRARTYRNDFPR